MHRNSVRFVLDAADLSAIRFGLSPGHELCHAVRVLQNPGSHPLQWGWLRQVRTRVPTAAFDLLRTVVPPAGYFPDFLTTTASWDLTPDDEVEAVRRADLDGVRLDLGKVLVRASGPRQEAVARLLADPASARSRLADAWAQAWTALLEPSWPQLRRLMTADVSDRARQVGAGGLGRMVGSLHPDVSWDDGAVRVQLRLHSEEVRCGGRGLMLVPSVLSGAHCAVITEPPAQPTLFYPAFGVTQAWSEAWAGDGGSAVEAVAGVVGAGRAAVLFALDGPLTTSQVARACGLVVSTASHHLTRLRAARLVDSRRHGGAVVHVRTPLGEALCAARG